MKIYTITYASYGDNILYTETKVAQSEEDMQKIRMRYVEDIATDIGDAVFGERLINLCAESTKDVELPVGPFNDVAYSVIIETHDI